MIFEREKKRILLIGNWCATPMNIDKTETNIDVFLQVIVHTRKQRKKIVIHLIKLEKKLSLKGQP